LRRRARVTIPAAQTITQAFHGGAAQPSSQVRALPESPPPETELDEGFLHGVCGYLAIPGDDRQGAEQARIVLAE
jgi:hypothetical protein